ncbi:hypothetical protein RHIZ404_230249 [Rhizobium sp. EC-SD404]|nr:hypothetical protein RHIZ404_230249 [Rhizobium sp. EC-SD404]
MVVSGGDATELCEFIEFAYDPVAVFVGTESHAMACFRLALRVTIDTDLRPESHAEDRGIHWRQVGGWNCPR